MADLQDVIMDLGETEVTVTCRSSSNVRRFHTLFSLGQNSNFQILLRHSYPEIASCGRRIDFPLNFAYIAGYYEEQLL